MPMRAAFLGGLLAGLCGAAIAAPAPTPEPTQAPADASQPCEDPIAAPVPADTVWNVADAAPVNSRCSDLPIPAMVRLPAGDFEMGDLDDSGTPYERPAHTVHVGSFAISRYEVTFEQWDACGADGGCTHRADDKGWGRGPRPVIMVSWNDAQQYVQWLSTKTGRAFRLPSEAEWEYAARAGTRSRFNWGEGSDWVCQFTNVLDLSGRKARPDWHWNVPCDDGYAQTAPAGRFPPNAWGLHDMHGNVWEWVEDCWHPDYTNAPADGHAWIDGGQCNKRVNRGGGWSNHPRTMRAATRDADSPDGRSSAMGFRVASD